MEWRETTWGCQSPHPGAFRAWGGTGLGKGSHGMVPVRNLPSMNLSCLWGSKGLKCPICFKSQWCCWQPDRPHCGSWAASDLQSKPHFTSFHLLSSMWSPGSTHNYFLLWKLECGLPTKYSSIAFWVTRAKILLYICPLQRVFWENESHMAFCSDDAGGLWWQVSREIWVR